MNRLTTPICFRYILAHPLGGLAQLGERLNGIQKVVGSIPIPSTNFNLHTSVCRFFLFQPGEWGDHAAKHSG